MGITFSKSSGVNNSVYGASQEPIKMFLEKRVEAFENNSGISTMFFMDKSKHFGEKLTGMTAMDGFQPVVEGGAYPKDEMQETYSQVLEHATWKDSFAITQEMVEDSQTMNLRKKPAAFINSYFRTREMFGAEIYGGGLSGTTMTFRGMTFKTSCNDGLSQFNTAHTSITGKTGTQSNMFTNTFSASALSKVETAMQNFKGDNGEVLSVIPNVILIPNDAAMKEAVFAAIGADKDPSTSNNAFNYEFGRWTVCVNPYLNKFVTSDNKPWWLLSESYNEEYGGAVWLDRIELEVKSYVDENTDNNIWKGRSRFVAGFNDWRFCTVGGMKNGTTLS